MELHCNGLSYLDDGSTTMRALRHRFDGSLGQQAEPFVYYAGGAARNTKECHMRLQEPSSGFNFLAYGPLRVSHVGILHS